MRGCLATAFILCVIPNAVGQTDLRFLFSADQGVPDFPQTVPAIEKQFAVENNEWLSQPLTRLDYVLMKMEDSISDSESAILFMASLFFERRSEIYVPKVEFSVRYSNKSGRVYVAATLNDVGEPKRPMSESCEDMLGYLEANLPLEVLGYSWQNNAIGLLQREESKMYNDIAQVLASSETLISTVNSIYVVDGLVSHYKIQCRKENAGGPVYFFKSGSHLQ